ncbi:serpin family protein [Paenibacillus shunpengii]|uniref:Serpin family protein n=1 Tax=Paenibacillus shunpengii TaxID=2054424 RepID=A0ABW5SUQ3_9BACL|nr:serpin family protein [Paenibacillus sp. PDC88]SDW88004.1 serpin B [Paenibacillus sp. PDC88]
MLMTKREKAVNRSFLAIMLVLGLSACAPQADMGEEIPQSLSTLPAKVDQMSTEERDRLAAALDPVLIKSQNTLGIQLMEELRDQEAAPKNVLISPYSIASALTLAYTGSNGVTEQEMAEVLGLTGLSMEEVNEASRIYMQLLNSPGQGVELMTANSVWVDAGYTLKPAFLETAGTSYGAEILEAELSSEEAMNSINTWVSERTEGLIDKMLSEPLDSAVRAYLLNALYFKGTWLYTFDENLTKEGAFTTGDGTELNIPMMHDTNPYGYKESEDWQAVRLPYRDSSMNMLVILPAEGKSLDDTMKQLIQQPEVFAAPFDEHRIQLSMPKYKVEYEAGLVDPFMNMGMKSAFEDADFSRMSEGDLFISDIQHKAVLEVNEKGSEAAAATSVAMEESGAMVADTKVMNINRPFFTVIEDEDTGAWLFVGSINNPRGAQ